jgi:RNA polymerase sigma factor (sigma-70 family)
VGTPQPISTTRTTTQLLDALREPTNEPAWKQIDARYRPVIAGLARRLGLHADAAEEAAQHTLTEFVKAYREGRYDRTKGRLSSWILGIAHHSALKVMRDGKREGSKGGSLSHVADEPSLRSIWDQERDRSIVARALAILRDESGVDDRTLEAFELVALRGVPAQEAASQCSMSVEQVYVCKTRVTKRLRGVVEHLTRAFEEDV